MKPSIKLIFKSFAFWTVCIFACGMLPTEATATGCAFGPYIIFFEPDSAQLDRSDQEVLDNVMEAAPSPCVARSRMLIAGFADTRSDTDHRKISEKRAKTALRYFTRKGIEKSRVKAIAFGDGHPLVRSNVELGEAQNRRVEIAFAPWPEVERTSGGNLSD